MANRYIKKKSSTLLITREMQIKTTIRCQLTEGELLPERQEITSVGWQGCGEKKTLFPLLAGM